eukprot:6835910-Pyramimonas_sp.AAC.1
MLSGDGVGRARGRSELKWSIGPPQAHSRKTRPPKLWISAGWEGVPKDSPSIEVEWFSGESFGPSSLLHCKLQDPT